MEGEGEQEDVAKSSIFGNFPAKLNLNFEDAIVNFGSNLSKSRKNFSGRAFYKISKSMRSIM